MNLRCRNRAGDVEQSLIAQHVARVKTGLCSTSTSARRQAESVYVSLIFVLASDLFTESWTVQDNANRPRYSQKSLQKHAEHTVLQAVLFFQSKETPVPNVPSIIALDLLGRPAVLTMEAYRSIPGMTSASTRALICSASLGRSYLRKRINALFASITQDAVEEGICLLEGRYLFRGQQHIVLVRCNLRRALDTWKNSERGFGDLYAVKMEV